MAGRGQTAELEISLERIVILSAAKNLWLFLFFLRWPSQTKTEMFRSAQHDNCLNSRGPESVADELREIGRQFGRPFTLIFDRELGGMKRVTRQE